MNTSERRILEIWKEKSGGWRWLHYHSMVYYKRINAKFVYSSIILSTLAGAGGFSTAGQKSDGTVMGSIQFYMGYVIGVTNVIIGLLNSFQRFGKAAEKTELHGNAAMQYSMLQRTLETELSMNNDSHYKELIPRIRQELDRLLSQSPPIPYNIVEDFDKEFPECENRPDVCGHLKVTQTPSELRFANVMKRVGISTMDKVRKFSQEFTDDVSSPTHSQQSV